MSYTSAESDAPNEVFRVLADPTRRGILEQLIQGGEQTVSALIGGAGVSQPAVSKHLSVLKQAGLVHDRPQGRTVHYRADLQGLAPLIDWVNVYAAFWSGRLDQLETVLEELEP